jgi:hypothetical protein
LILSVAYFRKDVIFIAFRELANEPNKAVETPICGATMIVKSSNIPLHLLSYILLNMNGNVFTQRHGAVRYCRPYGQR